MKRIFYRVKEEYDQHEVMHYNKKKEPIFVTLIAEELLTFGEVVTWNVPVSWIEGVIVSEKDWYPSFGARFLCENNKAVFTNEFDDILERRAKNEQ